MLASRPDSLDAATENNVGHPSYCPEAWLQRAVRSGLLPKHGCYRFITAGGTSFIRPLMEQLQWKQLPGDLVAEQLPKTTTLHWCCGRWAKELNQWRRDNNFVHLMFCSCLPNLAYLHNKKLLLTIIRNYEADVILRGHSAKAPKHLCFLDDIRRMPSDTYLPKTLFDLTPEELSHIADNYFKEKSVWIAKPVMDGCGRGIDIIRSREALLQQADRLDSIVIQKYITNPLILDGRKCDFRVYLLLVCPRQMRLLAFYHPGYVRLSLRQYERDSSDAAVHLTNLSVSMATDEWKSHRTESAWSPDKLNAFLNWHQSHYRLPRDFVFRFLHPAIRSILSTVSRAAFCKVAKVGGCFELLGADFMVDSKGKVWLLELNCHPGLITSTPLLKALKPAVVQEATCIAMECIAKQHKGIPLVPVEAEKNFQLLWDSDA